jgi:hypothetical protein
VVRQQYASEPVRFTEEACIVHWPEAMGMLRAAGMEVDDDGDLNGAQVRACVRVYVCVCFVVFVCLCVAALGAPVGGWWVG